jgi:hypothetical protein
MLATLGLLIICPLDAVVAESLFSGTYYLQDWSVKGRTPGIGKIAKGIEIKFMNKEKTLIVGDGVSSDCKYRIIVRSSISIDLYGDDDKDVQRGIVSVEKEGVRIVFSSKDWTVRPKMDEYLMSKDRFTSFYLTRTKNK